MEVLQPEQCTPPAQGSAVTIGAYDGVHLGHRALLGDLIELAAQRGLSSAVVTFDRHPAAVVRPESAPLLLTDLEQKLELLADCGIDRTVVIPFDIERANETAEDFVSEILVGALGARLVVVGEDFHFGHGRKGNVSLLEDLGVDLGFEVVGIGLHGDDGNAVSSTRIRALVAAGQVEEAALLLGRPHQVRGRVERGDGRGAAELGFPTANIGIPAELAVPGDGIYAGWYVRPGGIRHPACISVGSRPTFYEEGAPRLVEAYLLDFEGDLYGEAAQASFVTKLRSQQRFDSTQALIEQMTADVAHARTVLGADRSGRSR
jgi:riboflavin kinase/FMN adenylyltransferase